MGLSHGGRIRTTRRRMAERVADALVPNVHAEGMEAAVAQIVLARAVVVVIRQLLHQMWRAPACFSFSKRG